MSHYTDHVKLVMEKLGFPEEAINVFAAFEKRLDDEADFGNRLDELNARYLCRENEKQLDCKQLHREIAELADEKGVSPYTLDLLFLLNCTQALFERYKEGSVSENIYWDTMMDLKYKLVECIDCEEVYGVMCWSWYREFFTMERFAIGRFQYQMSQTSVDYTTKNGYKIKAGTPSLDIHIPSSGIPLTDEVRFDSYKKAHKYFRDYFETDESIFECSSWLLYPRHKEFLPPNSNILKFDNDFELIRSEEKEGFSNGWRVFGKYSDLPYDKLPTDTTLRKVYAQWLIENGVSGGGRGVIVFDGEKIIN